MFNNNNLVLLSKAYIIGIGIILGITTTFAITLNSTETQWSINDFDTGNSITQNMLLSQTLGFTCNDSNCSQKIYWKKISTSTSRITDAAAACEAIGMVLPSSDQISYYASQNNRYGLNMGTYTAHNSMSNAGSYHWGTTRYSTSTSCSSNSCSYYEIRRPNSWSTNTTTYGYNAQYYYCVYKRWH